MYKNLYHKIEILKQNFENFLRRITVEANLEKKVKIAEVALCYAVRYNTGYFTSSILEKVFTDYAKSIKCDLYSGDYKKNSFLHVISKGYKVGGHTRVVERWISNAPNNQIHSVVFTSTNNDELSVLNNEVQNKNGEIIYLSADSLKNKACQLRNIGMHYEYIILHIHMDDPTAVVAFGTEEFTRPVLFYNHASHLFWIGESIADIILDVEDNDAVTRIKRKCKDSFFLGVPSKEIKFQPCNKDDYKKKLGFHTNKKIIITAGAEYKYSTIENDSYINVIKKIIDNNTYCYAIGIKKNNKEWKKAAAETNNHIVPLGYIEFNNGFFDYLKAADLCLDSYPFCGGTASIDAIAAGTPIISLKSVYPQFDYLTQTSAYCATKDEFISKAKKVLSDPLYAEELNNELKNSLFKYQSIQAWNEKIEKLLKIVPSQHKVKDLSNEIDYSETDDLSVLCNVMNNKNFISKKTLKYSDKEIDLCIKYGVLYKKFTIPFIFDFMAFRKISQKIQIIKIFNIPFFKKTKKINY